MALRNSLLSPQHTPFGPNVSFTDQPQIPTTAVDPVLWAVITQALGAGSSSSAHVPTLPFQQPHGAPYSLQASNPLNSQPTIAGQPSALPQDLLGLVGQLLSRPAQDTPLPNNQFQAHQWPSHGVSLSSSNVISHPSTSSHIPSQSVASSSLANAIMNAHRSVDALPVPKHKRTSLAMDVDQIPQSTQEPSTDEEMDVAQHAQSSTRARKPDYISPIRRVFSDASGRSSLFYVQPSMKRRHELVETIKVHMSSFIRSSF
jgi:hypothetical protein